MIVLYMVIQMFTGTEMIQTKGNVYITNNINASRFSIQIDTFKYDLRRIAIIDSRKQSIEMDFVDVNTGKNYRVKNIITGEYFSVMITGKEFPMWVLKNR